jgi:hypothetical protein
VLHFLKHTPAVKTTPPHLYSLDMQIRVRRRFRLFAQTIYPGLQGINKEQIEYNSTKRQLNVISDLNENFS